MKRVATLAAAAVMGMAALTGCNGGDGSDYCNRIRSNIDDKALENIDLQSEEGQKKFLAEVEKLQNDAPKEIKDDYAAIIEVVKNPTQANSDLDDEINAIQKYDQDTCGVEYTDAP